MIKIIKKAAFKLLGTKGYLRLMQRGFFTSYSLGLLRNNPSYSYHYFDRKLINEGDYVIDIGANLGYYSKLFSKWVGKSGKVYAVEPIKIYNEVFKLATKNTKNIVLYPYALGDEEKLITLVTKSNNGYLNTGLPHVYDKQRDGDFEEQDFKFDAEMKIPNKLFADMEKIDFIKCDIEGLEYIVLSNMKPIIEQHKPKVQVEVWGENETVMIDLFASIGYTPYKLYKGKLTDKSELLKRIKADYIFIHKDDTIDGSLLY